MFRPVIFNHVPGNRCSFGFNIYTIGFFNMHTNEHQLREKNTNNFNLIVCQTSTEQVHVRFVRMPELNWYTEHMNVFFFIFTAGCLFYKMWKIEWETEFLFCLNIFNEKKN